MYLLLIIAALVGISSILVRDGAPLADRPRRWVVILAICVSTLGVTVVLTAAGRSLWIDEFGTLWAIERSLSETWSRVIAFHGQSPLYYILIWALVRVFGESEVVLRAPSLVLGALSVVFIYRTARAIGSREAGFFAASLFCLSPVVLQASASARAYALALLMASLAVYGYTLTIVTRNWQYRVLFVAGGAGLVLTQYISSLTMIGLGMAYFFYSEIRRRYTRRAFLVDVAIQVAVVLVAMPQVAGLWTRRQELSWIGPPNYTLAIAVLAPLLPPILVAGLNGLRAVDQVKRNIEHALALAMAAPAAVLMLLAAAGTNLLAPRYLLISLVPGSVLAGLSISRLRTPAASVSMLFAVCFATALSLRSWQVNGSWITVPHQDWRAAVSLLEGELAAVQNAVVLYRPGFVEQDPSVPQSPALLAPLRSPGKRAPQWRVVPLTFSWWSASREPYFADVIRPAIAEAEVFFVLIGGTSSLTGNYPRLLSEWIAEEFPQRFTERQLGPVAGVRVSRFDRTSSMPASP